MGVCACIGNMHLFIRMYYRERLSGTVEQTYRRVDGKGQDRETKRTTELWVKANRDEDTGRGKDKEAGTRRSREKQRQLDKKHK